MFSRFWFRSLHCGTKFRKCSCLSINSKLTALEWFVSLIVFLNQSFHLRFVAYFSVYIMSSPLFRILLLSYPFSCFTFFSLSSNYHFVLSKMVLPLALSHWSLLLITNTFLSSLYHLLSHIYICVSVILYFFLICSLHPPAFSTWSPLTSLISLFISNRFLLAPLPGSFFLFLSSHHPQCQEVEFILEIHALISQKETVRGFDCPARHFLSCWVLTRDTKIGLEKLELNPLRIAVVVSPFSGFVDLHSWWGALSDIRRRWEWWREGLDGCKTTAVCPLRAVCSDLDGAGLAEDEEISVYSVWVCLRMCVLKRGGLVIRRRLRQSCQIFDRFSCVP